MEGVQEGEGRSEGLDVAMGEKGLNGGIRRVMHGCWIEEWMEQKVVRFVDG